jgi:hypothetical protein
MKFSRRSGDNDLTFYNVLPRDSLAHSTVVLWTAHHLLPLAVLMIKLFNFFYPTLVLQFFFGATTAKTDIQQTRRKKSKNLIEM